MKKIVTRYLFFIKDVCKDFVFYCVYREKLISRLTLRDEDSCESDAASNFIRFRWIRNLFIEKLKEEAIFCEDIFCNFGVRGSKNIETLYKNTKIRND